MGPWSLGKGKAERIYLGEEEERGGCAPKRESLPWGKKGWGKAWACSGERKSTFIIPLLNGTCLPYLFTENEHISFIPHTLLVPGIVGVYKVIVPNSLSHIG